MSVSTNLLLFIIGAGILQGLFLSCLIYFHPRSDRSVSTFLALYIFCYCIPMFTPVIQHFFSWQLLILVDPFLVLIGPFLYLYVSSFKDEITFRKAWPHFILFLVFLVFDYYLYQLFISDYPPSSTLPPEIPHRSAAMIRVFVRITQMMVYFFLAGRALSSYQRSIQHLFSETSRISLGWVRWLINGYLVLLLLMIGFYLAILKNPEYFGLIILINTALVTPYMYAVTFKGITQPTLWQLRPGLQKDRVMEDMHDAEVLVPFEKEHENKVLKSALPQERRDEIVSRILDLMENDRIYLQSELTLQDLADRLSIPSYQVTQSINEGLQKNFYDLVNGYRVEEAKRVLLDPASRNSKILTIGLEAGFNSKTTFNTVFKKFTGFTPSEFKEQDNVVVRA